MKGHTYSKRRPFGYPTQRAGNHDGQRHGNAVSEFVALYEATVDNVGFVERGYSRREMRASRSAGRLARLYQYGSGSLRA